MTEGQPAWQPVLDYWFAGATDSNDCAQQQSTLWWDPLPEMDSDIRDRFGALLNVLVNGGNRYWLQFPESRLAAIIVLDQFSRHIHRDTPTAFSADLLALNWSLSGIQAGMDKQLTPIQRVFFYLPLEHAEDFEVQKKSVLLFRQLLKQVRDDERELFQQYQNYAEEHAATIEQFGRFPMRNVALDRESTDQELQYLEKKGLD